MKYFLRSTMSAAAPLGNPSKKTGSDDAVCTSAMSVGDEVSVVMTHAAATSFIHIDTFDPTQTSQRFRNVRSPSGAQAEVPSFGFGGASGGGAGSCSLIEEGAAEAKD